MSESKAQALWKLVRPTREQFVGIGLVVALLALVVGCQALGDDGPDQGSAPSAKNACEQFVDRRLKAPGSAEYELTATQDGANWTVTGTVDSDNSFGASLRSQVECVMRYSADAYHPTSITVR